MTLKSIKRFLKKENRFEFLRFKGIKDNKLYAEINGRKVYWRLEKKGDDDYLLSHVWYYTA